MQFPATYNDDWILSVGGSGTNGEHYDGDNGNDWIDGSGFGFPGASFGEDMDIIAPAVTENVMSLINPNFPWEVVVDGVDLMYPAPVGNDDSYQPFNGTSAAAPHVAGVAALMYSRHHVNQGQANNLAPEDVEFILQRYATDIVNDDQGFPIGYDDENGWGRLNAFEAVSRVDGPQWQVFHSGEPDNSSEVFIEEVPLGIGGLVWRKFKITHTYQDVFSATTQIVDSWGRFSSTAGGEDLSAPLLQGNQYWADYNFVINGNVANVSAVTYRYELVNSTGVLEEFPSQSIKTAYSLHLFDPQATSVSDIEDLGFVSTYPNPTSERINLQYNLLDAIPYAVQILDVTGKVIVRESTGSERTNNLSLDISAISSGIYICQLLTDKGVVSKKIIKQ